MFDYQFDSGVFPRPSGGDEAEQDLLRSLRTRPLWSLRDEVASLERQIAQRERAGDDVEGLIRCKLVTQIALAEAELRLRSALRAACSA